jgi:hypothetical protein
MHTTLLPPSFNDTDIPVLPPVAYEGGESNGHELRALYIYNHPCQTNVSCTYSACRNKCVFSASEFGEAMFERWSKQFLSSIRPIDQDYMEFLKGTLHKWGKQFNNFDLKR